MVCFLGTDRLRDSEFPPLPARHGHAPRRAVFAAHLPPPSPVTVGNTARNVRDQRRLQIAQPIRALEIASRPPFTANRFRFPVNRIPHSPRFARPFRVIRIGNGKMYRFLNVEKMAGGTGDGVFGSPAGQHSIPLGSEVASPIVAGTRPGDQIGFLRGLRRQPGDPLSRACRVSVREHLRVFSSD